MREIVEGEWGITCLSGPPDRPEPSPAEREAARRHKQIKESDLLAETGLTEGDLRLLKDFDKFPEGTRIYGTGWVRSRPTVVYDRDKVTEYFSRLRTLNLKGLDT